jgi:lipoyl(octanoyl) transferase
LHDRELTYSIVLPHAHPLAARAEKLYQAVHRALIETLAELGIQTALHEPSSTEQKSRASQPFLCFQRRERGDVLLGDYKIAGSAQRRQRGAVLQHGSVLWARSPFAPELPGIVDLATGVEKNAIPSDEAINRLRELWSPRLAERLKLKFESQTLSESLRLAAHEIQQRKFGNLAWTCRR